MRVREQQRIDLPQAIFREPFQRGSEKGLARVYEDGSVGVSIDLRTPSTLDHIHISAVLRFRPYYSACISAYVLLPLRCQRRQADVARFVLRRGGQAGKMRKA